MSVVELHLQIMSISDSLSPIVEIIHNLESCQPKQFEVKTESLIW